MQSGSTADLHNTKTGYIHYRDVDVKRALQVELPTRATATISGTETWAETG
jgi:hypothetical protein